MMAIKFLALMIPLLIFNAFSADVVAEEKEIKFIGVNGICIVPAKEISEAREYFVDFKESVVIPLKLALTILQIRFIKEQDYREVECALRFFKDKYNQFDKKEVFKDSYDKENLALKSYSSIISDYSILLEKIRLHPKYKAEFEKNITNGVELWNYYSIYKDNLSILETFEGDFARKVFTQLMMREAQGTITDQEWKTLFNLFFNKQIEPSPELKSFIINKLTNTFGNYNTNFMRFYLSNANEFAYNSLFKKLFENLKENLRMASFTNEFRAPDEFITSVFSSKFLPESFKCLYAKDIVATRLSSKSENVEELKKLNHPCLNALLLDFNKFITPKDGCPYISFSKNDDHGAVVSKSSLEFQKAWLDCRKKCSNGDKCSFVQNSDSNYDFFNSKFDAENEIMRLILPRRNSYGPISKSQFKYEIKPVGICLNNTCKEDKVACTESDILNKVGSELKKAKLLDCNQDSDCHVFNSNLGCTPVVTNARLQEGPMPFIDNFVSYRIDKLAEQCGINQDPFSRMSCRMSSRTITTKAKCENKICVTIQ